MAVDGAPADEEDVCGGSGAVNKGVAGNGVLGEDANGSIADDPPEIGPFGGGVGLGVVTGVVAVEGNGLK